MKISRSLIAATFVALPLALAAGAAAAQGSDLSRVEVQGQQLAQVSRTDVHRVCSHMDSTMQEQLARTWFYNQTEGEVRVQFRLEGGTITEVTTKGGPRDYHRDIRRAVHDLDCQTDASATQQFSFVVAFKADADDAGQMKMALLERQ